MNDADGVNGYDGVHDDSGRAEYNIGVGAIPGDNRDITGYWPGGCVSSCNENWATSFGAAAASFRVWHR